MGQPEMPPVGVSLSADVEYREDRRKPYRARVRWVDPVTKERRSRSESFDLADAAQDWVDAMRRAALGGVDPVAATMTLAEYGDAVMSLALRGLEAKTLDPYLAGWRKIDRNPAKVTGWQREYQRAEDELDDPRSLALPDWDTLCHLAATLVEQSADHYAGWGEVVIFAACTAARIGEVSGVRRGDVDIGRWIWTVRRQTTPGPGGVIDKATKGKRARKVPIIEEARELVATRLAVVHEDDGRLFAGPRGGRITTAVLRDATHWDDVVLRLGYEHLRRHDYADVRVMPTSARTSCSSGVNALKLSA